MNDFFNGLASMGSKLYNGIGLNKLFGDIGGNPVATGYSDGLGLNSYAGKMSLAPTSNNNLSNIGVPFVKTTNVTSGVTPKELQLNMYEEAFKNQKLKNEALEFNNSWFGGKGLAALGALNSIGGMITGYQAYRDNKKNSALQREIARYNLNQSKKEYKRLQDNRKSLSDSYYGRKG